MPMNPADHAPAITAEEFYRRAVERDGTPVPDFLSESKPFEGEHYQVDIERFVSPEYHRREVEQLWKRVWQATCREEEIAQPGDVYVYEIATLQYLIVRTQSGAIKAFPNSCLHRGRQLIDCNRRVTQIRCPFHAFTWDLDGRIAQIPCAWDFSHIDDPDYWTLPQVQVATWGGFVFINPDPDAAPLSAYLGDLDRHFERYPLDGRYIAAHARKVVPCNWKVAQEAFLETFHILGTHPQLLPQASHTDMKYDCYENYSRTVGTYYTPHVYTGFDPSEQEILDSVADFRQDDAQRSMVLEEGETAREHMARLAREGYERASGESSEGLATSELIDISFMSVFPNFHPWTLFTRICYLFRPYKNDPDRSWMDIYQIMPVRKGEAPPAPAPVRLLSDEEDWTAAEDLSPYLGRIANQDAFNFGPIQQGMKASATGVLNYSSYQESRIRHFHTLLDKWMTE